jgi:hypothetical protein
MGACGEKLDSAKLEVVVELGVNLKHDFRDAGRIERAERCQHALTHGARRVRIGEDAADGIEHGQVLSGDKDLQGFETGIVMGIIVAESRSKPVKGFGVAPRAGELDVVDVDWFGRVVELGSNVFVEHLAQVLEALSLQGVLADSAGKDVEDFAPGVVLARQALECGHADPTEQRRRDAAGVG